MYEGGGGVSNGAERNAPNSRVQGAAKYTEGGGNILNKKIQFSITVTNNKEINGWVLKFKISVRVGHCD